jgi:hypothetical protein
MIVAAIAQPQKPKFRQLVSMKLSSDAGLVSSLIPDHHWHDHRRDAQVELANSMEQAFRENRTSASVHSSS